MIRLKRVTFAFTIVAVAFYAMVFAAWKMGGPAISPRLLRRIETERATKAEVLRMLGKPKYAEDDELWIYERWWNFGWVEVSFDGSGRVDSINDESPYPDWKLWPFGE